MFKKSVLPAYINLFPKRMLKTVEGIVYVRIQELRCISVIIIDIVNVKCSTQRSPSSAVP